MTEMTSLDRTFAALGDGTRRAILARLASGETALSAIAAPFDMSQTAVSKHVRVLSDAGLVRVTKRGRTRYCRLEAAPMKQASDWLGTYQQFWAQQFESLAAHLEAEE
ncbi:MAG: metalloregulator ArsR/SmtB family transcription factor [Pseudomonadota bacterium]